MTEQPLSVGLMVPINNTTMEPELLAWLPEGSACRRIGIPRGEGLLTPDSLPAYLKQATAHAAELANDEIELVVYGCTAAGFISGPAQDAEVAADLARATRKQVVTTASAMGAVLEHIGARNIALITPYADDVNKRLRAFLDPLGIRVAVVSSFHAETVEALAAITGEEIAARVREIMQPGIDAVFIACSQLPTRAILPELERELGIPVWSSNRATAWRARRATKRD